MGNRTQESIEMRSVETRDYVYYANSTRLAANGKYGYVYDENGNLIAKSNKYTIQGTPLRINERLEIVEGQVVLETSGADVLYWEYDYDLMNRMVAVRKNGQTVAEYVYDPTGLRIEKKGTQGTIRYVFNLAGEVILKIDDANKKESRYIYVFGKTFAREDKLPDGSKKKIFYHTDIQGNIMQATDEEGKSIWKRDFLPFGTPMSEQGNVDEPAGFTGKEYDEDVELYYFNARWYNPELGRFVEEDPMADDPNLYSYGFNSPLNYIDPTGMVGESLFKFEGISFNTSGIKLAGAVLGAIGALKPELADACSVFSGLIQIVDHKLKIKRAERLAEEAAAAAKASQDPTLPNQTHQEGGYTSMDPNASTGKDDIKTEQAELTEETSYDLDFNLYPTLYNESESPFEYAYGYNNYASYVFYDPEDPLFHKAAKHEANRLRRKYGPLVFLIPITSEREFTDEWALMGNLEFAGGEKFDIGGVSLLFHGSPYTINIAYSRGEYLTSLADGRTPLGSEATYIGNLPKKSMRELNVMSCNGGHLDVISNIAAYFAYTNPNIGTVNAWDGGVSFGPFIYAPRLGFDQTHFNEWSYWSKQQTRKPLGRLSFTTKSVITSFWQYNQGYGGY